MAPLINLALPVLFGTGTALTAGAAAGVNIAAGVGAGLLGAKTLSGATPPLPPPQAIPPIRPPATVATPPVSPAPDLPPGPPGLPDISPSRAATLAQDAERRASGEASRARTLAQDDALRASQAKALEAQATPTAEEAFIEPDPVETLLTPLQPQADLAVSEEAKKLKRRKGRRSTILTNFSTLGSPTINRPTLLGA